MFAPDAELNARRHAAENAALAAIKSKLSAAERDAVIELANSREVRQNSDVDAELLLRVTVEDVHKELKIQ